MRPRYRILKYPWHTAHDYELTKLDCDFAFVAGTPRAWDTQQRPIPDHVTWVPRVGSVPTDAMILHVDQWLHQEPAKRHLFQRMRDAYAGPKIVINHGCNLVDGCSPEQMQELVAGCHMVCNSATAQQLWQVKASTFIRHGMTPEEWGQTDYGIHNIVVIQPFSKLHALCRNIEAIARVEKRLPVTWVGRDVRYHSFDKYRRFLRSSSIYFNPSHASANPRARTEAMLCGLAVVTTASHGEAEYIENGVNGYCSNDVDELIERLAYLYANPREARRIGEAGRATAQKVFHIDNFRRQWHELLDRVIGDQRAAA